MTERKRGRYKDRKTMGEREEQGRIFSSDTRHTKMSGKLGTIPARVTDITA